MSRLGHGRKFYEAARLSSYAFRRERHPLPFLTDAQPGASDDLEIPLAKVGLWLVIAAPFYALLALVGLGLGYLVELLLAWGGSALP
jgi:hypothetical protein